jgi:superfamily II DNA helicase RecQ
LQRQAQLQRQRLKGVVYCRSKRLYKKLADALNCCYYHADVVDQAERLAAWEQESRLIVATSALGTRVDYPGIVYIMHVGMLWSMINFAQESGRGGQGREVVDSVILVEHSEVERRLLQEADKINVQAMGLFIISSSCQQLLMSRYIDRTGVSCGDLEQSAGCDQCKDRVRQWLDKQESSSWEWQQVQELFNKLQRRCVACCLQGNLGRYSK